MAKSRATANASAEDKLTHLTTDELILRQCHEIYTSPDKGLVSIAKQLDLDLLAPRKKVTIMLIGNHSAGKSSFINWYIGEHVQKTAVAMETQGFTFVTSGRRRESLTGNATLHLYPHCRPLAQFPGLLDFISTEISTSQEKRFPLITFIDTPGLVDADMNYTFDVNQAILWLGQMVDLIFVFFDPIGQALCKRTLNIVEQLGANQPERLRFFLSKADEVEFEADRHRVMMQIVQEICKRPTLNRTGFDMPAIFIPRPDRNTKLANQIENLCRDIDKTIDQTIQNTLNHLEDDCDLIADLVDKAVAKDNDAKAYNMSLRLPLFFLSSLAIMWPLLILLDSVAGLSFVESSGLNASIRGWLGEDMSRTLKTVVSTSATVFWYLVPAAYESCAIAMAFAVSFLIMLAIRHCFPPTKPVMDRKFKRKLLEHQQYVGNYVKEKKKTLYDQYLKQTVSDDF